MPGPMQPLIELVARLGLDDSHRYVCRSPGAGNLPHNIRIFLRRRRAGRLGRALHNQHTLLFALRTPGEAVLDREHVRINPGEALLIFPGQLHEYAETRAREVLWLFCGFLLPENTEYLPLRNTPLRLTPRVVQDVSALIEADRSLIGARGLLRGGAEEQVALRLKLILAQLLELRCNRALPPPNRKSMPAVLGGAAVRALIKRAAAYISARLDAELSVAEIAGALHVSAGHLRNEFHRQTGGSIGRYVRYLRISRACMLMDTTALGLEEIARRCGYASVYSFSRAFKRDRGCTPSEYRKG